MKPPVIEGYHWGWQGPFGRALYNQNGRMVANVISSFFGLGHANAFVFDGRGRSEEWENAGQAYRWIVRELTGQKAS